MNADAATGLWTPILTGSDRAYAEEIVALVGERVSAERDGLCDDAADTSLAGGSAGILLTASYIRRWEPALIDEETIIGLLTHAVESPRRQREWNSLYFGVLGAFWAVEHLSSDLSGVAFELERQMAETAIERLLCTGVATDWKHRHELFRGLAGIGLYLLERPRTDGCDALVDRVANALIQIGDRPTAEHLSWTCHPEHHANPCDARDLRPYFSLSVPHGVAGPLAVLLAAGPNTQAQVESRRVVDWLLAQQSARSFPQFGFVAGVMPDHRARRAAWCYGDLGISVVLAAAGHATGEKVWLATGRELGAGVATVTLNPRVTGTSLCHGAAGNAHMFARLYQYSGDERFRLAALENYRALMDNWSPGAEGFAGFTIPDGPHLSPAGFLRGAAGCALALLAGFSESDPAWDRVLLMSAARTSLS